MRSELLAGVALALLGLALLNVGTGRQRDGARLYAAPLAPARVNRIAPAAAAAGGLAGGPWAFASAGPLPQPAPQRPTGGDGLLPYVGVAVVSVAALVGARSGAARVERSPRMMFGGGDKGGDKEGEGNFLDKLKKAQEMFSPEMMQKYQMVGQKLEQVKTELAATEVACELDEGVTVVFSGTSAPMSVTVSEKLCAEGPDAVSAAITKAMKEAHDRSGKYAAEQLQNVYTELGINPAAMGAAGGAPPPPA